MSENDTPPEGHECPYVCVTVEGMQKCPNTADQWVEARGTWFCAEHATAAGQPFFLMAGSPDVDGDREGARRTLQTAVERLDSICLGVGVEVSQREVSMATIQVQQAYALAWKAWSGVIERHFHGDTSAAMYTRLTAWSRTFEAAWRVMGNVSVYFAKVAEAEHGG